MRIQLLMLALAVPVVATGGEERAAGPITCTVSAHSVDADGHTRPARRVSASVAPVVLFRGTLSRPGPQAPTLLLDVFNPRGQRYQVLVAEPRVVSTERDGQRVERRTKVREAGLAVAGSSIAWTSMYGRWRVEPRLEGSDRPCGKAEFFTIRP